MRNAEGKTAISSWLSERAASKKCPIEETLKIVGNKSTLLILRELFRGRNRYSEFQKAIDGISSKTLAKRLREMERNQLVVRKIFPEIPPHVEYYLTPLGKQLQTVIQSIEDFGNNNLLK